VQLLYGREHELQAFNDAVSRNGISGRQVIVFYGPGGQGKTELCSAIAATLRRPEGASGPSPFSLIDFKAHSTLPAESLYSMRIALMGKRFFHLPRFDVAFQVYQRKLHPGIDIKKRYPEMFVESEISAASGDLADVLLELGSATAKHIPFVTMVEKYSRRLIDHVGHARTRRLSQELASMKVWREDEWQDQLCSLLAKDTSELAVHGAPPVVLFDHYEHLWRAGFEGDSLSTDVDRWVRIFCENLSSGICVIFARERLDHWPEMSHFWESADFYQIPISDLSARDGIRMLKANNVHPPAVRKRILQLANGHPLFLRVQTETFQAIRRTGRDPKPEDFGMNKREVISRFVDHLDPKDSSGLKVLSIPVAFNREMFDYLADRLPRAFFGLTFDGVSAYSFFQTRDDGYVVMHSVMRGGLQALCDSVTARKAHELTFAFANERWRALSAQDDPEAITYFRIAARHKSQCDEPGFPQWVLAMAEDDATEATYREIEQACSISERRGLVLEQLNCLWRLSLITESSRQRDLLRRSVELMEEHPEVSFTKAMLVRVRLIDAMLDTEKSSSIVAVCNSTAASGQLASELETSWRAHFYWCWARGCARSEVSEGFRLQMTNDYRMHLEEALSELRTNRYDSKYHFVRVLYELLNYLRSAGCFDDVRKMAGEGVKFLEESSSLIAPAAKAPKRSKLSLELSRLTGGASSLSANDQDVQRLRALAAISDEDLRRRIQIPPTAEEREMEEYRMAHPVFGGSHNIGLIVNAQGRVCMVYDTEFCVMFDQDLHVRYDATTRKLTIVLNEMFAYEIDWEATEEMHEHLTKIDRIRLIRMWNKRPEKGYDCSFLVCNEMITPPLV
jgi:RecA/RadA recombinase